MPQGQSLTQHNTFNINEQVMDSENRGPLSSTQGFDSVVISIPPKVGPNKSLYRYSNLREAYARKFIELSIEE